MGKMMMGMCCTQPDEVRILEKYGYEFIEADFSVVRDMSDEEFEALQRAVRESGVRCDGMNCFADPSMKLLKCSYEELDEYLEKNLARPKLLGVKYIVIGSGGARRIPEGMSYEEATEKFVTMLKRYGDIAERYDVDIVVEPLFSKACNFINTFEEALEICKAVEHPHVGLLMDFFHSYQENEPFSVLEKAGKYLKHIHFSALDRRVPNQNDVDEVKMMIAELKAINYTGRVLLEGDVQGDFETEMREYSALFPLFD